MCLQPRSLDAVMGELGAPASHETPCTGGPQSEPLNSRPPRLPDAQYLFHGVLALQPPVPRNSARPTIRFNGFSPASLLPNTVNRRLAFK